MGHADVAPRATVLYSPGYRPVQWVWKRFLLCIILSGDLGYDYRLYFVSPRRFASCCLPAQPLMDAPITFE